MGGRALMEKMILNLGSPSSGTIHGNAERAVALLDYMTRWPQVGGLEFTFNGTRVHVFPADTATAVVNRYFDAREKGR